MDVAVMVDGQEDVSWTQWSAIAMACEAGGYQALFAADHYASTYDRARGALDAWGVVTALSVLTQRIRLGVLVSPPTFRHPSVLARLAVTADHVSKAGSSWRWASAGMPQNMQAWACHFSTPPRVWRCSRSRWRSSRGNGRRANSPSMGGITSSMGVRRSPSQSLGGWSAAAGWARAHLHFQRSRSYVREPGDG